MLKRRIPILFVAVIMLVSVTTGAIVGVWQAQAQDGDAFEPERHAGPPASAPRAAIR